MIEESLPGCEGSQWHGGSLYGIQADRFRREVGGLHRDIFGGCAVSEKGGKAIYGITDSDVLNAGGKCFHDTAAFVSGDRRQTAFALLIGVSGTPIQFVAGSRGSKDP